MMSKAPQTASSKIHNLQTEMVSPSNCHSSSANFLQNKNYLGQYDFFVVVISVAEVFTPLQER